MRFQHIQNWIVNGFWGRAMTNAQTLIMMGQMLFNMDNSQVHLNSSAIFGDDIINFLDLNMQTFEMGAQTE